MFALGLLVGIYSYLIFILGITGILNKYSILLVSALFIFGSIYYFYKKPEDLPEINIRNRKIRPFLVLFAVLAGINLFGAFVPERAFDALWYHLSLPKIYLSEGMIFAVKEGIFYYSSMPKLGEMLFTPFVAYNLDVFTRIIQWGFGILTSIVIYKIARRNFDEKKSMFSALIFYGSIIVAWQSTVAYVDLIRTFFEVLALWGILIYIKDKDKKILIEAAVFAGLAVSTKLLALGTIPIFAMMIILFERNKIKGIKSAAIFSIVSIIAVSPWLIVSFVSTGNPIYPILNTAYPAYPISEMLSIKSIFLSHISVFVNADILISPIYIIFLPLGFIFYKKLNRELKIISVFTLFALIVWYFIPRTGGGRFLIPILPAASVLVIAIIEKINSKYIKRYSYALIVLIFIVTIFYRGASNFRHTPVVFGLEGRDDFLIRTLNFEFGDFYDTDKFFEKTIKDEDNVLLVGFHNIYYVDFPFTHLSYINPGDKFNYIAVQNAKLPERFNQWEMIYANEDTNVKLYSLGGLMWQY